MFILFLFGVFDYYQFSTNIIRTTVLNEFIIEREKETERKRERDREKQRERQGLSVRPWSDYVSED